MTEEIKQIIIDEIKLQRFKNKINQEDMAKKLGMSTKTYMTLENNPERINLAQGFIISDVLNWNLYDFIWHKTSQNVTSEKGE